MFSLQKSLSNFERYTKLCKSLKPSSLSNYRSALKRFAAITDTNQLSELTHFHRYSFWLDVLSSDLTHRAAIQYARITDSYYHWLVATNQAPHLARADGCHPYVHRSLLNTNRVLHDEPFHSILELAHKRSRTGKRDLAMFLLMDEWGLSADSIRHIRAFNFSRHTVTALDNCGFIQDFEYQREDTIKAMLRWQRVRPTSQYLFCTEQGYQLGANALTKNFQRYKAAVGLRSSQIGLDGFFHRFVHRKACLDVLPATKLIPALANLELPILANVS